MTADREIPKIRLASLDDAAALASMHELAHGWPELKELDPRLVRE